MNNSADELNEQVADLQKQLKQWQHQGRPTQREAHDGGRILYYRETCHNQMSNYSCLENGQNAKSQLNMMIGTNVANFDGHLAQVVFQNHHRENIYQFFEYMKVVYNLEGDTNFQSPWTPNLLKENEVHVSG